MYKKILSGVAALLAFAGMLQAQETVKDYDLDEVVVTATRMNLPLKSIPQKVEIIDKDKILSIPAENAAELLKRATNLDMIQYPGASATVGMRGFSPTAHARSYTLVMIDGLPSGTSNLTTLPTSVIERIEVIKGPYSVLYGTDAMGGVINIITKKATLQKTGEVSLKGGSFGTTSFDANAAGMLSDRVGVVVGFSNQIQQKDYRIGGKNLLKISKTEKLILDEKSYDDVYPNTTFQMSQLFGKLNYSVNNQWNVSVSSFYNLASDVETPGNYFTQIASKKDIGRLNLFSEISHTSENNKLIIAPYYSNEKNWNYETAASDKTNFISFKDDVSEYGVRTNNTYYLNHITLLAGMDYDVLDYQSTRQSKKGNEAGPYKPNNRNQRLSAFVQTNYELGDLSINGGLRANYIRYKIFKHDSLSNKSTSDNFFYLIPSLGLKYNLPKGFNVHASVGKAFSIPDAFATSGFYEVNTMVGEWPFRMAYVGNADLKPETSITYEGGMGYYRDTFYFDLTYFNTTHKNKIVTRRTSGMGNEADSTHYENAKSASMSGLEFIGSINIGQLVGWNNKVEIYGGLTYMFNNTFTEFATEKVKDLLFVNKANGNFGISYDNRKGFTTRLHARYKGRRLERDGFSRARPLITKENYYTKGGYKETDKILQFSDHLIFDYSAFYNLTPKARIGISVSNLFDENYTEKDGYNMPGRNIMGHVSYFF